MASPDWPGNKDLKTRNSLVHSLLIFLIYTQPGNESTAREETTFVWLKEMQQVKRCMHYHDNGASIRIDLIQLKVNWFYSINYIKLYSSKIDLINKELNEISNWFKANKLSVNASKTNYMILGISHITNNYIDVSEHYHDDDKYNTTNIACQVKEQTPKQCYLG